MTTDIIIIMQLATKQELNEKNIRLKSSIAIRSNMDAWDIENKKYLAESPVWTHVLLPSRTE
jgi:hypothetical protein